MTVKELVDKLLEMPQNKEVELLVDGEQMDIVSVADDRTTVLILAD